MGRTFALNKLPFRRLLIVSLGIIGLSLAGSGIIYAQTRTPIHTYLQSLAVERVTVKELKALPSADVLLVDVRSPEEYAEGHIPRSILIPVQDLEAGFGLKILQKKVEEFQTATGKDPQIVVYCHSGSRSIRAYKSLETELGLSPKILLGGMEAWRKFAEG